MRELKLVLNVALVGMVVLICFVAPYGYDRWVAMEDARRGQ